MPHDADDLSRLAKILEACGSAPLRSSSPGPAAASDSPSPESQSGDLTATLAKELQEVLTSVGAIDLRELSAQFPEHGPILDQAIERAISAPSDSSPVPRLSPPVSLGRYQVTETIGSGGFGIVYRGWDEQLERVVAIKVARPEKAGRDSGSPAFRSGTGAVENPSAAELDEARFLAKLDHPRIVPVYDVGQAPDGGLYVVSKFIEGRDLGRRLREGRISYEAAAAIVADVAEALDYAHNQGVVHRDVKPGNILLTPDDQPVLVDFGLAIRDADMGRGSRFVGTPAYMSPEQARQEGHRVDGRTDVYSLGAVLYHMLTGLRPFKAHTIPALLDLVRNVEVRPPRQLEPKIPRELERICLKALSKRVADRYNTARDLAEDLRVWLSDSVTASMPSGTSTSGGGLEGSQSALEGPRAPAIVPRGLRSFDAADADFFLELLPGARDRDGLPESIRFWKTRIEQTDADQTFRTGVLLGPSGSGKSSLVHAGLVPHLDDQVLVVSLESRPHEMEARLLRRLVKSIPALESAGSLREALLAVRRGRGLASGRKLLLVFDQFEQWLNYHAAAESTELVEALRQCDGARVQALLLIRDDFTLAATQFMDRIEEPLSQSRNFATVDPFGREHAERVLIAFGRSFGALAENPLPQEQTRFLAMAIDGLADSGHLMPIQLALFAEMVKDKPWTVATLRAYGGTHGIGTAFLEEKLNGASAHPFLRAQRELTRELLSALLPADEGVIKGPARTRAELIAQFSHLARPDTLDRVLHLLDTELRLLTPSGFDATASVDSLSQSREPAYQLAHDYLVPTLRDWLTAVERTTRRGRVTVRLRELSDAWSLRCESRRLPTTWEWLSIRLWTQPRSWSPAQRRMMKAATRRIRRSAWGLGCLVLILIPLGYWTYGSLRAASLRMRLRTALTAEVPGIVEELRPYRWWGAPMLQEDRAAIDNRPVAEWTDDDFRRRFHLALALVDTDPEQWAYILDVLPRLDPDKLGVIPSIVASDRDQTYRAVWPRLRAALDESSSDALAYAAVLAQLRPDPPPPEDRAAWDEVAAPLAGHLVRVRSFRLPDWIGQFRAVDRHLAPVLLEMLERSPLWEQPADRADPAQLEDSSRHNAIDLLLLYASENPRQLAAAAAESTPSELRRVIQALRGQVSAATALRQEWIAEAGRSDAAAADPVQPDDATQRILDEYHGFAAARAAIVQTVPLKRFEPLLEAMRQAGFRPTSVRPYENAGRMLVAASWDRADGHFRWLPDLDAAGLQQADAEFRGQGLRLADIAWYPARPDKAEPEPPVPDPPRTEPTEQESAKQEQESDGTSESVGVPGWFAGLWIGCDGREEDVRVVFGGSLAQQRMREDLWGKEEGFVLDRLLVRHEPDGEPLCWSVWLRFPAGEGHSNFSKFRPLASFGDIYPGYVQTDCRRWQPPVARRDAFVFHEALSQAEAESDPDPTDSERAIWAQWHLALGRPAEALAAIDALLTQRPNNSTLHFLRAEALAVAGRKEALRSCVARHAELNGPPFRQHLLEVRLALLDEDLAAGRAAAERLEAAAAASERDAEAAWAAARMLARIAEAEPEEERSVVFRQRAVDWLRAAIIDRGRATAEFDVQHADLNAVRGEPRFGELLAERGLHARYAATWCSAPGRETRMGFELPLDEHRETCEDFAAAGFRPVCLELTGDALEGRPVAASVWQRARPDPAQRLRHARRIAALTVALAELGEPEFLWDVLDDVQGRDARSQTIEQLSSSRVPVERLVAKLRASESPTLHRAILLALGGYPVSALGRGDRAYLEEFRLPRLAAAAETADLRAAAIWCARQWGMDAERHGATRPSPESGRNSRNAGWYLNSLGQMMVRIEPPRETLLGSPLDEPQRDDTEHLRWVRISRNFAVADTETTVAQFQQFLDDPRVRELYAANGGFRFTTRFAPAPDCPQISARWFDAARFCQWLSESEGVPEDQWCYPGIWTADARSLELPADYLQRTGYRLLTEAEWEFACRGGSLAARSFGDAAHLLPAYGWYGRPATQPVGQLRPNDFGLSDMLGNAAEWCSDAYHSYRFPRDDFACSDEQGDSLLVVPDRYRVVRGGAYSSPPSNLRSADRVRSVASDNRPAIGFRIGRTLKD